MACCIIAAFLLAQAMAVLRRWGIFWGVVRPVAGEDADTVYQRIGAWLARPAVRRTVTVAAAVELMVLGTWVYQEHGTHLYRLADQGIGQLRGERIVYGEVCTPGDETDPVRMVIRADGTVRSTRI